MNKIFIVGMLLVVGLVGTVFAFGGLGRTQGNGALSDTQWQAHHDTMEQIMEEGSYADLVSKRDADGVNYMPMVDREEQFIAMQERHAEMEQYREENGIEAGQRMHNGQGMRQGMPGAGKGHGFKMAGQQGNCPMLN
ncbi:MAG: hypothetical protein ABIA93_04275 [Candidatus Woesearchaeota archaeon]